MLEDGSSHYSQKSKCSYSPGRSMRRGVQTFECCPYPPKPNGLGLLERQLSDHSPNPFVEPWPRTWRGALLRSARSYVGHKSWNVLAKGRFGPRTHTVLFDSVWFKLSPSIPVRCLDAILGSPSVEKLERVCRSALLRM